MGCRKTQDMAIGASTKKKPCPRKPRKKPTPKPAPVIHITINVVAKKKPDNSKQTLLMYDKYVAERQGYKFSKLEMK